LESSLKQLAPAVGIERNIIWAGRKPHAEIPIWMSAANFLILPSLSEGYPMVVLESLACGTPVIASRVGGIPEILVSDDFGTMVQPRDSEALTQAILNAIDKKWDSAKLVAYAHANTWTERAQRFMKVYQDVLKTEGEAHRTTDN
jgi:glycosyltransferase involved in cell wall biosynthesis